MDSLQNNQSSTANLPLIGVFILSLVVTALIYSNTFNAPFVFDDRMAVFNDLIQSDSPINPAWLGRLMEDPRPLTTFSFAVNFYFGGLNVFGYHLVNFMIHILATWSVFVFTGLTMNLAGYQQTRSRRTALVVCLLFAVHPIQTQAVTYLVQRAASMASLFYLWAMLAYIQARTSGRKKYYFLCFLSALMALGSKPIAAIIPLTLFLYEFYFFQQRDTAWLKKNRLLIALVILATAGSVFFYLDFDIIPAINSLYVEYSLPFSPFERVLTEQRVLLHYLSLIVFPLPSRFSLEYDFPVSHGFSPATVIAMAFHAAALVTAFKTAKSRPVLSFSIFWFYLNQVIESSFLGLDLVYEHRMYLPSLGLFTIAGLCYSRLESRIGRSGNAALGVLVAVLSVLGWSTYTRNRVWKSNELIWEDVLKKSPDLVRAHINLGNAYLQNDKKEKAKEEFKKVLQLNPENLNALNNLGVAFKRERKWSEAEGYFQLALQLKPEDQAAASNLAEIFIDRKHYGRAEKLFLNLINRQPENYLLRYRLALVFLQEKKIGASADAFLQVIRLKPDFKQAYSGLWNALQAFKDRGQAETLLEKALPAMQHAISRRELSAMLQAIKQS